MAEGTVQPLAASVLHVVGEVTDEVFSFIGPATEVLAALVEEQVLIMIDVPRYRHHLPWLPASMTLLIVPTVRNPLDQWRAVYFAYKRMFSIGHVEAVHFHGLLPCCIGVLALMDARVPGSIIFSPHASRALKLLSAFGHLIRFAMRPLLRGTRHTVIVNRAIETRTFVNWKSSNLVESPVRPAFVSSVRNEARLPLIVTGGRDQVSRSGELFARLAVLLSGADLRVTFNWIGAVDPATRSRLDAAGIGIFDIPSDDECAARLATGWMYLAAGRTRGFPHLLVQAMAVGLPCIALDCSEHRDVIEDGVSGYLCSTDREVIFRIAALIDSPELRKALGRAARTSALLRFGAAEFGTKLLAAYEIAP